MHSSQTKIFLKVHNQEKTVAAHTVRNDSPLQPNLILSYQIWALNACRTLETMKNAV